MKIRRASGLNWLACSAAVALGVILGSPPAICASSLQIAQMDHTAWTARDGAPQAINSVAQAPDGTLWIGADGGLYNFDGRTFNEFKAAPGEPTLPSNVIESVIVTREGTIWVGLYQRGIARISGSRVTLYDSADGLPMHTVRALRQAPDDSIWALAQQARIVKLGLGGTWQAQAVPIDSGSRINGFFIDSSNTLWVPQAGRLYRRAQGETAYTPTSIPMDWLFSSSEAADGTIWMADVATAIDRGRTQHFDRMGNLLSQLNDGIESYGILAAPDNSLWMATQTFGLRRYQNGGQPQEVSDVYQHLHGLSSDATGAILLDTDGNVWVGGRGGLDRFRAGILTPFIAENPTGQWSICANTKGDVWIGGEANQLYKVSAGVTKGFAHVGDIYFISCAEDGSVLYLDHAGIWHVQDDRIVSMASMPGAAPYSMLQVFETEDHTLYATMGGPLSGLWTCVQGRWARVPGFGKDHPPIVTFADSRKRLWTGYGNGEIRSVSDEKFPLSNADSGAIYAFADSSYGLLAAGMNGVALLRGPHFVSLSFADPISARGVTGVIESRNGDLWLNGTRGVIHIPAEEIRLALGDTNYLIKSERIAEGDFVGPSSMTNVKQSAARDGQGQIWFAMLPGVVSLAPERLGAKGHPPIVSIRSISADSRVLAAGQNVPAKPQRLDIQYFGVNLTAPEKVTYRYRLEGFDNNWQDVGNRTEAIYTLLPPGAYTFQVIGSNGNADWTKPVSSSIFRVLPSFYQTWWFRALCGLIFLLCFWMILSVRVKYVTRAVKLRSNERADERVRIARDLHDTLLQGIQGLMLRFHVAAQRTPAGGETRELLDAALDSADAILIEARDRVSRLRSSDPADLNLAEEYTKIAADLDYEKRCTFTIEVNGSPMALNPLVREELYFIGREALTNAFHHADASHISVAIKYERAGLSIAIRDDGCGFHPSSAGNGEHAGHWGLLGMMERAHRIGAEFDCRSAPGEGTTIGVSVAARRAFLHPSSISRWLQRRPR